MRIATQGQSIEVLTTPNSTKNISSEVKEMPTVSTQTVSKPIVEKQNGVTEEQEISKEKLQQAVDTVNEFLQINHSSSKFVFHDGLERYFVQVVDAETEEVVKEIPPRKLLDAFYEMQKLLGMIVDEKI
ncbi:flagellar protein FlaG [Lysinibacillus xylanilyticus]|uniref:flagellar protein FlaG n=1 Tax=Lysinibacillus xylanilyticus TaxID=582475 RepID=UPI00381372FD